MSTFGTPSKNPGENKEVLTKKVSEIQETILNNEEKENFKDVLLTLEQAAKLKEGNLTVSELTKLQIDQLRTITNEYSPETLYKNVKVGAEKAAESAELAKVNLTDELEKVSNSKGGAKVKKTLKKIKDKATNFGVKEFFKEIGESMKSFGSGLLVGFFALISKIMGLFGFGQKAEKLKNKAKEKLSTENIEKTRKDIIGNIEQNLLKNKNINPLIKEELNKILNDKNLITEENIIELKNRLEKNGKLTSADLKYIIGLDKLTTINKKLWTPKNKALLQAEAEKAIVDKIYKKYSINIKKDKRKELELLIKESIDIKDYNFLKEQLLEGEIITVGDLLSTISSQGIDFGILSIQMIAKGIVPAGNVLMYMGAKSKDAVSIGFSSAGLGSEVNIDTFKEQIDGMTEIERGLLMGTLYRQTGFLSNILGSIASSSTKLIVESLSSTTVKSSSAGWSAFTNNIDNQTKNFTKLERIFGQSIGKDAIKTALNEVKILKTNNEIIRLLNQSEGSSSKFKNLLKNLNTTNLDKNIIAKIQLLNIDDFPKLRVAISESVTIKNTSLSSNISKALNNLGFSTAKYEFKTLENTNKIIAFQQEAIRGGKLGGLGKFMKYFSNISGHIDLSRSIDALHFENLSKTGALNKMQAISKMFHEFPILSKSIFGAVPEIAFFGLALNGKKEDETWLNTMIDTGSYMLPVIGPIRMVLNTGGAFKDGEVKWFDIAEGGVGVTLGIIDAAYITKILATGGEHKTLQILGHIAKPITSSYTLGRDLVKTGINIKDVIKTEGKINWLKIGKGSLQKLKGKKGKIGLAIGIIAAIGYAGNEFLKDNAGEEYQELIDKGIIDNEGKIIDETKLKLSYEQMNNENKKNIIELIFMLSKVSTTDLEFNLDGNSNLTIISHSKEIRTSRILTDPRSDVLRLLSIIGIKPSKIKFIPGNIN